MKISDITRSLCSLRLKTEKRVVEREQKSTTYQVGQEIDIVHLANDIVLTIGSHLEARDLLSLALSCRQFGWRLDCYQNHSLMEEVAMRRLTENATQQQIACIPRERGESWIGLYNWPEKMKDWRALNAFEATGDRSMMKELMDTKDLRLMYCSCFDPQKYDVRKIMCRLYNEKGLFKLIMEGDEEVPGLSDGYLWSSTRKFMCREKMFREMFKSFEALGMKIHQGVISYKLFDWRYANDDECMGSHFMLLSILPGKKMRFTDGDRECTLTLPHGRTVLLSKDYGKQFVDRVPPPYYDPPTDPNAPMNNIIPRTDTNEPADAFFLMLDISFDLP